MGATKANGRESGLAITARCKFGVPEFTIMCCTWFHCNDKGQASDGPKSSSSDPSGWDGSIQASLRTKLTLVQIIVDK
jgi:hypothetical protein